MPDGAARAASLHPTLTRGLVIVTGFALLLTLLADVPTSGAANLGSQISSARRSQSYYESVMRAQDRQLERLQRAHKAVRNAIRRGKRHVRDVKERRTAARQRVAARSERLEHLLAKVPEGEESEPSEVYLERLQEAEDQLAGAKKSLRRVERRASREQKAQRTRYRRLARIRRQTRAAVARQNAAEAALGGQIVWMTRLAQQRASQVSASPLGPGGDAFAWPAFGTITQRYGCTGFRLNPRRGSCRYFHNGIDVSPDGGTAIRSVAAGVVAYVGWNPWDAEGRAFILVVGHADGYYSRYGHLQPSRQVRVGQLVGKGEIIGRMGSTGKSTGVHLHMELLDRSGTVDPLRYFPQRAQDGSVAAQASAPGRDARRRAGDDAAGPKGRKAAAKGSKAAAKGSRRDPADGRGDRRGGPGGPKAAREERSRTAAREAHGAGGADAATWALVWPDPCEPTDGVENEPGSRDRIALAGLAEASGLDLGAVAAVAAAAAPLCEGPDGGALAALGAPAEASTEEVAEWLPSFRLRPERAAR